MTKHERQLFPLDVAVAANIVDRLLHVDASGMNIIRASNTFLSDADEPFGHLMAGELRPGLALGESDAARAAYVTGVCIGHLIIRECAKQSGAKLIRSDFIGQDIAERALRSLHRRQNRRFNGLGMTTDGSFTYEYPDYFDDPERAIEILSGLKIGWLAGRDFSFMSEAAIMHDDDDLLYVGVADALESRSRLHAGRVPTGKGIVGYNPRIHELLPHKTLEPRPKAAIPSETTPLAYGYSGGFYGLHVNRDSDGLYRERSIDAWGGLSVPNGTCISRVRSYLQTRVLDSGQQEVAVIVKDTLRDKPLGVRDVLFVKRADGSVGELAYPFVVNKKLCGKSGNEVDLVAHMVNDVVVPLCSVNDLNDDVFENLRNSVFAARARRPQDTDQPWLNPRVLSGSLVGLASTVVWPDLGSLEANAVKGAIVGGAAFLAMRSIGRIMSGTVPLPKGFMALK